MEIKTQSRDMFNKKSRSVEQFDGKQLLNKAQK